MWSTVSWCYSWLDSAWTSFHMGTKYLWNISQLKQGYQFVNRYTAESINFTLITVIELMDCVQNSLNTLFHRPYCDNEAPLLEVLDQRNGVLFEVGQAAVDGLGIIVRPSLLLGSFVQPLLQTMIGAGQEHHQVRGADLPGERIRTPYHLD